MSSGAINPISNPQAWDRVSIGQTDSPGMCKVGEFKREHEWDIKKGKGTLGATVTFVGRPPAKGAITFYLWTASHFDDWDRFRPLLKFDPTKKTVQAVDIYHPSLADIDVNSVVTESIGNIVHEGSQMYSIQVGFLEYFPPPKKSAVGTPSGSASTIKNPKTTPGDPGDPITDAKQKQIEILTVEAQKT